jgi:hypothetical protein
MSYDEILKEEDALRVRLVSDEYPEEPYDDFRAPLLRIDVKRWYTKVAEHITVGSRPTDDDDAIENAVRHWSTRPGDEDWPKFEKYLRAYYGVTRIDTWYSGDYWYVSYDSDTWKRYIGYDDVIAPLGSFPADYTLATDLIGEYKDYVNGEVYSYVVEHKVHVYQDRRIHAANGDFRAESTEYDTWEQVDAIGGFYGYKNAVEAAEEAFDNEKEDLGK